MFSRAFILALAMGERDPCVHTPSARGGRGGGQAGLAGAVKNTRALRGAPDASRDPDASPRLTFFRFLSHPPSTQVPPSLPTRAPCP
jgi:hypothetical protein